jgi:arsenate reductase-like glutaredoxin family protein
LSEKDALNLAKQVDYLYATKGKQVIHLDLKKERPDKAALLSLLLGPTGNLRAPAIRVGRVLVIGFDAGTYKTVLKK